MVFIGFQLFSMFLSCYNLALFPTSRHLQYSKVYVTRSTVKLYCSASHGKLGECLGRRLVASGSQWLFRVVLNGYHVVVHTMVLGCSQSLLVTSCQRFSVLLYGSLWLAMVHSGSEGLSVVLSISCLQLFLNGFQ